MSTSPILLTGGSGFIGNAISETLLAAGHKVLVYDRTPPPAAVRAHLESLGGRIRFMGGDILDAAALRDVFARDRPAFAIHGAAITAGAERERADLTTTAQVNFLGTVNMLEAARAAGLRRFVYLSSASVYGESVFGPAELDESLTIPVPDSLYAITKYASERLCLRVARQDGLDVRAVRLGTAFGPFERETGLRDTMSPPFQVMRLARVGEPAILPRDGRRDWIYSRDIGAAVQAVLATEDAETRVLNLGLGSEYGLLRFAQALRPHFAGFSARLAEPSETANVNLFSATDRAPLANRRLVEAIGYRPRFGCEAAAEDYARWLVEQPELAAACFT